MTYLGSGIWSYTRFKAGAILSVSVPATTIRSAWRGPWAMGITPSRMKSCFEVEVAISSIAQHANPKFITHSEYFRPQFRMNLTGCGTGTLSRMLTWLSSSLVSGPLEHPLSIGVQETQREDEHEDGHLDNGLVGEALEDRRPREQEDALDVEDHEQERVDVIPDLGLAPALPNRVDPALVGGELLRDLPSG